MLSFSINQVNKSFNYVQMCVVKRSFFFKFNVQILKTPGTEEFTFTLAFIFHKVIMDYNDKI